MIACREISNHDLACVGNNARHRVWGSGPTNLSTDYNLRISFAESLQFTVAFTCGSDWMS